MKQPRYYQTDLINSAAKKAAELDRVIIQAPTGAGKSLIMSIIAERNLRASRTVLVLSETRKIYDQLVIECNGVEINSDVKHLYVHPGRCYVAMAQTIQRRPLIIKQFRDIGEDLTIMVDECHVNTTGTTIEMLLDVNPILLGFTATPAFKWAKHLPKYYNDCVQGPEVSLLIKEGFLCDYQHIERQKPDLKNELDIKGGEFTEQSQERFFGKTEMYKGLVDDLKLHEDRFKKGMVFTSSIKSCEETVQMLLDNDLSAISFHSQNAESESNLKRWRSGEVKIAVSVASLTKGFDEPSVDLIALYRATTSLPLYLQMIGRGSRPVKNWTTGEVIKDFFLCLDYGMNCSRHQVYYYPHDWSTMWNTTAKKNKIDKEGVSPVKLCPQCESMIAVSARICPFCAHEIPMSKKELQEGVLVDMTAKYNNLKGKKLSELSPTELALYAKQMNKRNHVLRVVKAHEQRESYQLSQNPDHEFKPWLKEFAAAMGYKTSWVYITRDQIPEYDPANPESKIDFYDISV